ncbi:MAG: hypothetical protein ACUVWZ_13895 [Anaerolineae bacterium]
MKHTIRYLVFLAGLVAVLLSLACAPCGFLSRLGAPPPAERIEVSQEAAQRLEEKLRQALSQVEIGEFTLTATDEEVTSFIAFQMEKSSDTPVRDVQVHFEDGRIYAWAILADVMPFDVGISLVATVGVVNDQLQVDIVESSAGVIPIPQGLLDSLSRVVNETIAEAQMKAENKIQITEVAIGNGEITISGKPSLTP